MPPVLMRNELGRAVEAPEADVQFWVNQGYSPVSVAQRVAEAKPDVPDQGLAGTVTAGITSALSGATLGLSDVVLSSLATGNERERLRQAREQNPTLSTVAEIGGNIVPALASGGVLGSGRAARALAATPAGAVSRLGAGVAELGAGAGVAGRAGALALGAGIEGAAQAGGSYLAHTALEDKPLSAEGFIGAMGAGGLLAGGIGGALGIGERALVRARSLFPRSEVTAKAAQEVERAASTEIRGALDDGEAMQGAVTREIEAIKLKLAKERLAAGMVPDASLASSIPPGRVDAAIDPAAARRPRTAFGGPGTVPVSEGHIIEEAAVGAGPEATRQVRRAFGGSPSQSPPVPARADTAQRAVFDLEPPAQPRRGGTVPWQELEAQRAAPPSLDEQLRRVARAGNIDLAPALEPVIPRGETAARAVPGSLDEQLVEMARQANAGVPLREMRAGDSPIPAYEALNARLEKSGQDYFEQTLSARDIADRGWYEPAGGHQDVVRNANARRAIQEGQREQIKLGVTPSGNVVVIDGRHRLAAAADLGANIRVKWTTAFEPAADDVFRGGGARGADAAGEVADEIAANADPRAARILDAARKEASARAEVVAMLGEPGATAPGRRGARGEAFKRGGTIPAAEIEAMKARGHAAPTPRVTGGVIPEHADLVARLGRGEGALEEVIPADVFAKRGWGDANDIIRRGTWAPAEERLIPELVEKARAGIKAGAKGEPFMLHVTPEGQLIVGGGRAEKFAAAVEAGGPIRVKVTPWLASPGPATGALPDALQNLRMPSAAARATSMEDFIAGLGMKPGEAVSDLLASGRGANLFESGATRAAAPAGEALNDMIATALGKRVGNMVPMGADIADAARKISAHEEALANLADALGEAAPQTAVARAGKLRAAQAANADAHAQAAVHTAQILENQAIPAARLAGDLPAGGTALGVPGGPRAVGADAGAVPPAPGARAAALGPDAATRVGVPPGAAQDASTAAPSVASATLPAAAPGAAPRAGRNLGALADLGAGLEVLKALGIAVPDIEKLPVIGPVLGMYLKARAALGIWKRAGGAVPASIEGLVAQKAAGTRDRVAAAMQKMLDVSAAGVRAARPVAAPLGALGARLFPTGGADEKRGKSADPVTLYNRRMDELATAAQPGAIERFVHQRVPVSDPQLLQAITEAYHRKLSFLGSKAPRPPAIPSLLKGDGEWRPSKEQLATFARYIEAAEDPAKVLEDVAAGRGVTMEAAEALRVVYPSLFQAARVALLQHASQMQDVLPYARRVSLSVLFQVPTDPTTTPSHVRFLRQWVQPRAAGQPAQGAAPGPAPAPPVLTGPVSIDERVMSPLDRRATQ